MYEDFFRLEAPPFSTNPDPSFIFWSKTHELSFTMLRYGVMSCAQMTVVTGEIGAGKTTLVRHLLTELPDWITVGLISNAQAGRGDLLQWVSMALDLEFGNEPYVRLLERFQDYAIECFAAGRRLVLIFDEAQNLSTDMLEELRMLSNINADGHVLLQLILVGQPQLRELIRQPGMVQFAQRISSDYHLENLRPSEVSAYIRHRLLKAGAKRTIFSEPACALIAESTGSVPRLVNVLCDLCLCWAFAEGRDTVDTNVVVQVLADAQKNRAFGQLKQVRPGPRLVPRNPNLAAADAADEDPTGPTLVLIDPISGPVERRLKHEPATPASRSGAPSSDRAYQTPDEHLDLFWVYENWISGKVIVHKASCYYCNQGRGVGASSSAPRGQWYGPFAARSEAEQKARATGRPALAPCKICIRG